ncbi:MAG: thioredoxin domain-containing protein [Myxococcota bacterium]
MTDQQRSIVFYVLAVVALIGAGIGGLMTWHHDVQLFGDASMQGELIGCKASEEVNCDIVNTSEYSELLGVPIATWGIATYLLIAGLAVGAAQGIQAFKTMLLALGVGAVAYSGFLFYISKVQLNYVCAWCMRLYAINLAVPVLALIGGAHRGLQMPSPRQLGLAVGAFVALSAVSVGGERVFRSTLLGDEAASTALVQNEAAAPETEDVGITQDPDAPLEPRELTVTTEDKNEALIAIRPDDAWKGNPNADVVVVKFADLECGYCKRASSQLHRLYDVYKDDVLFVFKHYPMHPACNPGVKNPRHRYACKAAQASVCAQRQGRFWAYHDLAYKNQHQLKDEHLQAYAKAVELDMTQFNSCMQDQSVAAKVIQDGKDGAAVDVHGTPRIFIDGRLYRSGTSAEQMAVAIERALGRTTKDAREAAKALAVERAKIEPVPDDVPSMRSVRHGSLSFQIDTFEAALTASGAAKSGKHEIPATQMSWFAARDACEAAGRRMCTEEEWIAACQNAAPVDDDNDGEFADDMVEGTTYPYDDFHSRNRCWDGHSRGTMCGPKQDEACRPVYTGEMPGCISADGVYDMTGNVEEWVGATPETAVLLGGAFDTSKDHARCFRRNDVYGPGYSNVRTGFRCCR